MSFNARPTLKPLAAALGRHFGWTTLALLPGLALAGPSGEQVQQGAVAVTRPDANTTTITQGSNNAVVNWHSFSVDGHEYVQFVQPGANAAILNRVTGGNASQILGRIDANGRVFLVNPQGVYFGAGSRVDTAGFAASTLDIANDDFMQGRYVFAKGSGAPEGTVQNDGRITGDQFVVLMGERVANEGLEPARLVTVALAAGEQVSLQLDTSGLVSFAVDEATAAAQAGVENTGEILAHGGRVLMTAKVANDLVATAVNNAGAVRAVGVDEQGGQIYLRGAGGNVVNSGTLDASGKDGGRVVVQSTTGDVDIQAGAVIKATGTGRGEGGTVRLVGQQSLDLEAGARVDTRGGDLGTGGVVEVSAHEGVLAVDGTIAAGQGGEVIIDPARLGIGPGSTPPAGNTTLSTVGKGFIESQLDTDTNVTLIASDEIFASGGPFTISASGSGSLTMRIGSVVSGGAGSLDGSGSVGGDCGSLGLCANVGAPNGLFHFAPDTNGDINLAGININILGNFQASAGSASGNVAIGAVRARQIAVNVQNTGLETGNVALGALTATDTVLVNAGDTTGNLTVGAITVSAPSGDALLGLHATGGNVNVNGPVSVTVAASYGSASASIEGRVVNMTGNVSIRTDAAGGSAWFEVNADNGINVNGNITVAANGGDSASISMTNRSSGNITINGNVRTQGASSSSINLNNRAGNINLNGNVTAVGSNAFVGISAEGRIVLNGAAAAIGTASIGEVRFTAQHGITVTGGTLASGERGAGILFSNGAYGSGSGDIKLPGPVLARAANGPGFIDIFNARGAVTLGGLVSADATPGQGDRPFVRVGAAHGALQTTNGGVIKGDSVILSLSQATLVDVRTSAPAIYLENYGGGSPDVSVDNRTFNGATKVLSAVFGSTDGRAGYGGDSLSATGGLGAVKMAFAGDATFIGTFAAQNATIQVDNGALHFVGEVLIGKRNLPDIEGDGLSLLALSRSLRPDGTGIPLPRFNGVTTSGPNAVFRARTGIAFKSGITFDDPDTPYVVFRTDGTLDLGPGVFSRSSISHEFLAQFTSFMPMTTIHVENVAPLLPFKDGPTFANKDHFAKLPGTTMIIGGLGLPGGPQTGSVIIGEQGTIDIGAQNILFSSRGVIRGAKNVLSTGFIGEVGSLQNTLARIFQTPIVNEFDEVTDEEKKEEDKESIDVGAGEGATEEKLVAQQSNNGQMCQ